MEENPNIENNTPVISKDTDVSSPDNTTDSLEGSNEGSNDNFANGIESDDTAPKIDLNSEHISNTNPNTEQTPQKSVAQQTNQNSGQQIKPEETQSNVAKNAENAAQDATQDVEQASGSGSSSMASSAFNGVKNAPSAMNDADTQTTEENAQQALTETVQAVPKATADFLSGNEVGFAADVVAYATTTLPKLVKAVLIIGGTFLLMIAMIIASVGMLPSAIIGAGSELKDQKVTEHQIVKSQQVIYDYYNEQVSTVVSELVKSTKGLADISSFSTWKRVLTGKNDNCKVVVNRVDADSIIRITNVADKTGVIVVFKDIYFEDYSALSVNKVALLNAFTYYNSFKDDPNYVSGIPDSQINAEEGQTVWRSSDTSAFKKWLNDNKAKLVTYSAVAGENVIEGDITYKTTTYTVNASATENEIFAMFGFNDIQKEQVSALNGLGSLFISMIDSENETNNNIKNSVLYPKLDVYTNLVGAADGTIWPMLPQDYEHLIANNDANGTSLLIYEIMTMAKSEKNSHISMADFLTTISKNVDTKIKAEKSLIENVFKDTPVNRDFVQFLVEHNSALHYPTDKYVPQAGDIVALYVPPTNELGEPIEPNPDDLFKIGETDAYVSDLGLVTLTAGNSINFIHTGASGVAIQESLDVTDSKFVLIITPSYESVASESLQYDGEVFEKGNFLFPLKGTVTVTATYPFYPDGSSHTGVDFACPIGTPVVAANTGTVTQAIPNPTAKDTYGKHLVVEHELSGTNVATVYAHCSEIYVKEGDFVVAGQLIALSGNTGNVIPAPSPSNPSAGAHLHFEARKGSKKGTRINPISILRNKDDIKLHAVITN